MPNLRMLLVSFAFASGTAFSQQQSVPLPSPTADSIMALVAANQDKAEAERSRYVYLQHAHIVSRKGKTIMCEETTDARITPSANGSHSQLIKLDGRVLQKHAYLTYTTLPKAAESDMESGSHMFDIDVGDSDRELVEGMRADLTQDSSKDGIGAHLFPLTTKNQTAYNFHLIGRERVNGRDVFHLEFHPRDKNDYVWKGDTYVDAAEYQPVVVSTSMAKQIPFAVRALLGTNVPGLGFTVTYAPQPGGTWFPVSFGTEFKIHVLFLYSRTITIGAENKDFEKTHVESRILGAVNLPTDGDSPTQP